MGCKNSTCQNNVKGMLTFWCMYPPRILHDSNRCYEYLIIAGLLQGYWVGLGLKRVFCTLLPQWRLWTEIYMYLIKARKFTEVCNEYFMATNTLSVSQWVSRKVEGRELFTAELSCVRVFIMAISHVSAVVRAVVSNSISVSLVFSDQVTVCYIWGLWLKQSSAVLSR